MTFFLLAALAFAGPDEELVAQRARVADAAQQVAMARSEGAKRSVVAERMTAYREEASKLAAIAAPADPEALVFARRQAGVDLAEDLAEGRRDSRAREVLSEWLGAPAARIELLGSATHHAGALEVLDVARGLLLDVVEQADALVLLINFDTASLAFRADGLALRARGLRSRGPGQSVGMSDEVEALRLEQEAESLEQQAGVLLALLPHLTALRADAVRALESDP